MVNPHDKTVLVRDLQIPAQEDESIFDGEIVVPDFDRASDTKIDRPSDADLEHLSIPELERISIPALTPADPPLESVAKMPRQAALPTQNLGGIPSLPATSQRGAAQRPGLGARPAVPAPQSGSRSLPNEPIEFDDEFESFQAGGLSNVQAQMLETVQTNTEPDVPWPTGNSPDYQAILIDPLDAQVRANFGPAPTSPLHAPEYAIKVFRRRRELEQELLQTKARAAAADTRREERLADLANASRNLEGTERFQHLFSNFEKLEQQAQERQQALAGDNQEYAAEIGKADGVIAENQKRSALAEAEVAKCSQKLAEAQQQLNRSELQYKRVLIEIRSLKNAEEEAHTRGKPISHATRIAELMGHVQTHQAALAKRNADRSAAEALLSAARKESQRIAEEDRRLKKERGLIDKAFQQRLGLRSKGVEQTQKEVLAEAAQAARALLGQRGGINIPATHLNAVRAADEEVLRELKAQRLLEVAVGAYDRDTYLQGRNFILGAVVIVLLLIVMQVFRNGNDTADEQEDEPEDARATVSEVWRFT